MQVILREDVEHLGRSGEVVSVRDGYGRNYLIPKGYAMVATSKNLHRLEHEKRQIVAVASSLRRDAEKRALALQGISLSIAVAVGEENKLFGSVTLKDIEQALRDQDIELSRKAIEMPNGQPIRALGLYTLDVKLHAGVTAKLKVWVVAK